jgi:hypothetical protein
MAIYKDASKRYKGYRSPSPHFKFHCHMLALN